MTAKAKKVEILTQQLESQSGLEKDSATKGRSLADLFYSHSSYVSDKWEQYIGIYEIELAQHLSRGKPLNILEIGIQNGGSLQIWGEYFPLGSSIYGIDIDPKCASLRMPSNIEIFVGDASDARTLDDRLGTSSFDVIIDDGSHRSNHVIAAFENCFSRLRPGGLYFVEDLHCSYSAALGGGFRAEHSSIEYLKRLTDALHADHFAEADRDALPADELARLRALCRNLERITFYDSIAVIARLSDEKRHPYARMLTGSKSPVMDPSRALPWLPVRQLHDLMLSPQADLAFSPGLRAGLVASREELAALRETTDTLRANAAAAEDRAVRLEGELRIAQAALAEGRRVWEVQAAEMTGRLGEAQETTVAERARSEAMLRAVLVESAKTAEAERARLEAASRAALVEASKAAEAERNHIEAASRAALVEASKAADAERARLEAASRVALAEVVRERDAVFGSTTWRATQPVRRLGRRLPAPVRQTIRRAARATYWMVTLQFPGRLVEWRAAQTTRAPVPDPIPTAPVLEYQAASKIAPVAELAPVDQRTEEIPVAELAAAAQQRLSLVPDLLAARFPALQPYPCFPVTAIRPRVSLVTDGVGAFSLFGGVGTAIILGALLANRLGADLRIVTRRELPDAAPIQEVLLRNGIVLQGALELAMIPQDGSVDLPLSADEIFLTTSWWTTRATLGAVPPSRIVALVQEDERMFYPHGDERLRCAETLSQPGLLTVVNTETLFRHLVSDLGLMATHAKEWMWFEPAFPARAQPHPRESRRRFFFYARPHNERNLFWRGIEALDEAATKGLFPAEEWEMHWIGRDAPEVSLPRGIVPRVTSHLPWGQYQEFIASIDAGFVLMDTPHPSYPPLDLAAAGAAVLTNTHPGKESLSQYSENILLAPPTVEGLVKGLGRLQTLAENASERERRRAADRIDRDWAASLELVVSQLAARLGAGI